MRLTKIKLAGFKSFVDPTTLAFPGNLTGIVGPNGCGKSNVIDAVRWVMGESSAKYLRGESMADVVFNGSTARKPVSTATIELVFDNSDGSVGGQYANYNEIAIRRQVSRDGGSSYFLNGTRCRRRDITDIFLGTGLGPRSYAIIEQGTISRLIDAKPEEMRVFLEEAAGISKYKDRRRETENRIRHTRENISRLNDILEELNVRINRLQRQARTAERYKKLKSQQRQLSAELLALKWRELDRQLADEDHVIIEHDTDLQASMAGMRAAESEMEQSREQQQEMQNRLTQVQARAYDIGANIARAEQNLKHERELRQRRESDLADTEHAWRTAEDEIKRDNQRVDDINAVLAEIEPALAHARDTQSQGQAERESIESQRQQWQERWDAFQKSHSETSRASEVENTRISHLERQTTQLMSRIEKLNGEHGGAGVDALEKDIDELEARAQELALEGEGLATSRETIAATINEKREALNQLRREQSERRKQLADTHGRLTSLQTLQQQALGHNENQVVEWLQAQGVHDPARLAQVLEVDSGWEQAVETVLGGYLQAVCLDDMEALLPSLADLEQGTVHVLSSAPANAAAANGESLAAHVKTTSSISLDPLLGSVFVAQSVSDALARRASLDANQSLITPDGVWMGPNWARVARGDDDGAGTLVREREIKTLETRVATLEKEAETGAQAEQTLNEALKTQEQQRETVQAQYNRHNQQEASTRAALNSRRERLKELTARQAQVAAELKELQEQQTKIDDETHEARRHLEQAVEQLAALEDQRPALQEERDTINAGLNRMREQFQQGREHLQQLELKQESQRATLASTRENLTRMQKRCEELDARRQTLKDELEGSSEPIAEYEQTLQANLEKRTGVEQELTEARRQAETVDHRLRELDQQRLTHEREVERKRSALEAKRLASQELRTRRQTYEEQLEADNQMLIAVLVQLPDDGDPQTWTQELESVDRRIRNLGSINLAAIEEYEEECVRAEYMEQQHNDLNKALETLEDAIQKIDRETRTRFKETFDRVNTGLKANFPRLFGGGHAYLELTGEDLLDAGVTVMARPPGKRNSTIHLLSGGEKALTAVALVFSIFELNPAPFCMLDEVDAPLDDANVGRFCDLVKEMAERVQFVFISHNKVAMEMASHLTGVTMKEAGVSRLVTVDVDKAAEMAMSE